MVVVAISTAAVASACATTYDTSATTGPTTTASPTRLTVAVTARASTADRLATIAAEVGALSERLVASDGQSEALARVEAEWAVVRPTIEAEQPELIRGFDAAIAQVRRSVERRRPADADKAAKNLQALIAALDP